MKNISLLLMSLFLSAALLLSGCASKPASLTDNLLPDAFVPAEEPGDSPQPAISPACTPVAEATPGSDDINNTYETQMPDLEDGQNGNTSNPELPEETEPAGIEPTSDPVTEPVPTPNPADSPAPTATPEPTPDPTATPKPTPAPTAKPTPSPGPNIVDSSLLPYRVEVDVTNQVVSVYKKDSDGNYTILVRQMICSTGKPSTPTILGSFEIPGKDAPNFKGRWGYFSKYGVWAQYFTRIKGGYLFHSIIYSKADENTLKKSTFDALGTPVSAGCIRLLVPDAKWIYDNIDRGTIVDIVKKEPNPELTASLKPKDLSANSLTREAVPVSLTLDKAGKVEMAAGETAVLKALVRYGDSSVSDETSNMAWTASKAGIVKINGNKITAIAPGKVVVTGTFKGISASVEITVTGSAPTPAPVPTPEPSSTPAPTSVPSSSPAPDPTPASDPGAAATPVPEPTPSPGIVPVPSSEPSPQP